MGFVEQVLIKIAATLTPIPMGTSKSWQTDLLLEINVVNILCGHFSPAPGAKNDYVAKTI